MRELDLSATLLWITPNAEAAIEIAGRTCYKSEDKITGDSAAKFIKMLIERGHHAMIEHAAASIKFVCDRGVTHELVRHRIVSYAQESTRYCNYGKNKFDKSIGVIKPPFKMPESSEVIWRKAMANAESYYLQLIDNGEPPELARSVLPICLKTEIVTTCNLREWRHIFTLRTSKYAHPQIRKMMIIALGIMQSQCPAVFEDFERA